MPDGLPPPLPPSRSYRDPRGAWLLLGWFLLAAVLLVTGFYLEERVRCAHAWAVCKRDLQARGEQLSWPAFIPAPIPDGENLAMAPLFERGLGYHRDPVSGTYTFGAGSQYTDDQMRMPFDDKTIPNLYFYGWEVARPTDLAGYQSFYRANPGFPRVSKPRAPQDDVLLALTRYNTALDALAQAAGERPLTRFPVDWYRADPVAVPLSHYQLQARFVKTLALRAAAHLSAEHPPEALRDLTLALRLSRDLHNDPSPEGLAEECSWLRPILNSVWDGLSQKHWSAGQLRALEDELQRLDLLADCAAAVRAGRAANIQRCDYYKEHVDRLLAQRAPKPVEKTNAAERAGSRIGLAIGGFIIPSGWFDLINATCARYDQDARIDAVDARAGRVYPQKVSDANHRLDTMRDTLPNRFVKSFRSFPDFTVQRAALMQTGLNQARVACALESFFVDHHAYPLRLDELTPAYLNGVPGDLFDGKPLRYRQTPDGRYQVYSIGWNSTDEGGQTAWLQSRRPNREEGDWAWQYTELRAPDSRGKK